MAQAILSTATGRPNGSGILAATKQRWEDYKLYRRTLNELQALSDRDLLDLGISRLSIHDIARESVYAAKAERDTF